jgi:hypothetical protein
MHTEYQFNTIMGYRDKLPASGKLTGSASVLIVGREHMGELEAQVRGCRHAWDIRLISADSLIRHLPLLRSRAVISA